MGVKSILRKVGIGSTDDKGNDTDADSDDVESDAEDSSEDVDVVSGGNVDADTADVNNYLAPEDAIWYRDKVVVNGKFARTYAIDGWPPSPPSLMFSQILMNGDIDYDMATHYEPYADPEAIDILDEVQSELEDKRTGDFANYIPDKGALAETEKVVEVMKKYINQGETMFDVSTYITVYADSQEEINSIHKIIRNDLVRSAGVSVSQCRLRQKTAMQSASPNGKDLLGPKHDGIKQKMLGSGAAQTFPFFENTFMEEDGVLFGVNEESNTPVVIDIFNRRNGYNMLTSGMIGAGKSFSSSQVLISMDAAYEDFKQFIVDPMGGFQGVSHCLDGQRVIINGSESINPLEIQETPQSVLEQTEGKVNPWSVKKNELKWFFSTFFSMMGEDDESLSREELGTLDSAITLTYEKKGITEDIETHHKESPTIMDLIETLENMAENTEEYTATGTEEERKQRERIAVSLLIAMDPFKPGGEYHNLAQPTEIDITGERTVYLDLTQIPENSDEMGVMMQLLFMKIYQEAKQTSDKVAFTIDEAHKIMRDGGLTSGLEEMFRHSRHFDMSINLISQTPEEFYATDTARTISKQCTIKRFHRVDGINEDVAKDILDMNDREIDYIENAEMGEGDKDYSQALIQISDEDLSIPVKILATRDEAMVIDYDPEESLDEYSDPQARSLKNALDMKNQTEAPIYTGNDDALTNELAAKIANNERNRERVVERVEKAEEIARQEAEEEEAAEEENNASTGTTTTSDNGLNAQEVSDRLVDDTNTSDDEYAELKSRLDSPEEVDKRSETEIELIQKQYDIGDENDDIETLRKKIKEEVFDFGVMEDVESPPNIENGSGGSDTIEDSEDAGDGTDTNNNDPIESTSGHEGSDPESDPPTPNDKSDAPEEETHTTPDGTEPGEGNEDEVSINESTLDQIPEDEVEKMYLQYVGEDDTIPTEQKREELKDLLV